MLDTKKSGLIKLWLNFALLGSARKIKKFEFDLVQANVSEFFENVQVLQVLSALSKFHLLAQNYAEYLISVEKPIFGIKPLKQGILKLQHDGEMVTALHREFCRLCIKAKCYPQSYDIIKHPVTTFRRGTQTMDIIVYTYYRGLLFTGLKNYEEAMESFKLCLSCPTQICHKVHTESFKKLILLSLIAKKQNPILPQFVSPMLRMKLDHQTQNYSQLSHCFVSKDEAGFNIALEEGKVEFLKDKNAGLIKKVRKEFEKRRICDLGQTYLSLNHKEILNRVCNQKDPKDGKWLESTLFKMIKAGDIQAKIDSEKQMISFIDTQSTKANKEDEGKEQEYIEVIEQLEKQNERIIDLMRKMERMDKNIKLSVAYQQKQLIGKSGSKDQEASGDFHSFA